MIYFVGPSLRLSITFGLYLLRLISLFYSLLSDNVVSSAMVKINNTFVKIEEATSVDIYEEDFDEALKEPEEENKIILVSCFFV